LATRVAVWLKSEHLKHAAKFKTKLAKHLATMTRKQDFLVNDLKRLILSINGGRAARLVDATRLYRCEIPFEANPKVGFKESYCQFSAMLKKWAKEMCFVIVASHWMIRVHGLGDLKIAFYQNVLPSSEGRRTL